MELAGSVLIAIIALLHVYIFIFEAFFWEKRGPKIFTSFPRDLFPQTTVLAFNQGVYNLFLAAGLGWSFLIDDTQWQDNVALFFLGCIAVAGLAGALTERKIIFVQTLPALTAMALVILA